MTTHPFRPVRLVLGLLVVLASVLWFVTDSGAAGAREVAAGAAITLVVGGLAGIALTLRRSTP